MRVSVAVGLLCRCGVSYGAADRRGRILFSHPAARAAVGMDGYAGIFDDLASGISDAVSNIDLSGALNAGVAELQQLVMTGQIDPNVLHQAAATAATASTRLTTAANAAGSLVRTIV